MMMIATVLPLAAAWSNLLGDSDAIKAITNMLQKSFNEEHPHSRGRETEDEAAYHQPTHADEEAWLCACPNGDERPRLPLDKFDKPGNWIFGAAGSSHADA
jgi:hypothetical protein